MCANSLKKVRQYLLEKKMPGRVDLCILPIAFCGQM